MVDLGDLAPMGNMGSLGSLGTLGTLGWRKFYLSLFRFEHYFILLGNCFILEYFSHNNA